MEISSYSSIFNLGHKAVVDIEKDLDLIVEEKIDGSQFSFGLFRGEVLLRSKGAEIYLETPQKMFKKAVDYVESIKTKLPEGYVFRGEVLDKPKHNFITYDRVPLNNIIIFDIDQGEQNYVDPSWKIDMARDLGLECVPLLHTGPISFVQIQLLLEKESVLGGSPIEGVVLKAYNRFGEDKKVLMGKFVREDFKEVSSKRWKENNPRQGDMLEYWGSVYRSEARWRKAIGHLRDEGLITDSPKDIGMILREIQEDVVREEEDTIRDMLWEWAKPHITRKVVIGMPQWYKEELLKKQFEEKDEN